MATRMAAAASAGSGATWAGARPAAASADSALSCATTSASSRPPTTAAPRRGVLRAAAVAAGAGAAAGAAGAAVVPAMSAPANTRAASGALCRPGSYSSRAMWKLVPPKPKALTPARRGSGPEWVHSRSSVFTRNGVEAQSTFGLGSWKCRLGGSTLSFRLMTALNMPAAPAAAFRWPMLDLTEPRAMDPGATPWAAKISSRAPSSVASPTRVDVPCASSIPMEPGSTPALRHARLTASFWPTGLGAVMPLPLPSDEPPIPRMTAYTWSPAFSASERRLSTKSAAPSPITKPSAPASNGRVPVADRAPILQNLTKAPGAMLWSMPPEMQASY